MDAIYPASNWLGVPDLDPDMQPDAVPQPVWAWGSKGRTTAHAGTWHLYVDDSRFSALLREPDALVSTGALAAVEPNISVYDDTPMSLVLASLYRKRWVARYWQTCGVKVFADLNLPARVLERDEWRAGLPARWAAFATRGYDHRPEALDVEYAAALSVCPRPLFLVVGGGKAVAAWCAGRPGVVHSGYTATKRPHSGVPDE